MSYICCLCLFLYGGIQYILLFYVSTFFVPRCDVRKVRFVPVVGGRMYYCCLFTYSVVKHVLTIWVTCKRQKLLSLRKYPLPTNTATYVPVLLNPIMLHLYVGHNSYITTWTTGAWNKRASQRLINSLLDYYIIYYNIYLRQKKIKRVNIRLRKPKGQSRMNNQDWAFNRNWQH